jgi:hypothetical protein
MNLCKLNNLVRVVMLAKQVLVLGLKPLSSLYD